eukprot:TRINITY_DN4491_c0_g1_i10.p1 TRINITY_DN4491_c0_g1~~TRINITY_DN4491_c0_g1_i10.p1  ORF type:complete len:360 (-),score=70.02 TRINITY_DN4491_c0_g1_i10:853-1932(-)
MIPSPEEHRLRIDVLQRFTKVIRSVVPDAEVVPFGSIACSLYLPQSDMDVTILNSPWNTLRTLFAIRNAFYSSKQVRKMQMIPNAKVPILKVIDSITGYPVDISVAAMNGIDLHQHISMSSHAYPPLRPLIILLKSILGARGLKDTFSGGLGSYAIFVLVLGFLKAYPVNFPGRSNVTLAQLLLDLLYIYGTAFNYVRAGISARSGLSYFDKSQKDWYDYMKPATVALEDPQDPTNNVGRNSFRMLDVRNVFLECHQSLLHSQETDELIPLIVPTNQKLQERRKWLVKLARDGPDQQHVQAQMELHASYHDDEVDGPLFPSKVDRGQKRPKYMSKNAVGFTGQQSQKAKNPFFTKRKSW